MTYSKEIESTIMNLPMNKIFFASEKYKVFAEGITELNYYKVLERMYKKNKIAKVSKGVYYIPKKSRFGNIPISESEIINSVIKNKYEGIEIGYGLYNSLGLTTQITKNRNFYCNSINNNNKRIKSNYFEYLNMEFNENIIYTIQTLEILQNYSKIENLNNAAFINHINILKTWYKDSEVNEVLQQIKYKKSTIAFLQELLEYLNIQNSLDKYLSKLSKYNIPNWSEHHEITY